MAHEAGFCGKCGIIREDIDGSPVTDCICTAKEKHDATCLYLKAVAMPVSVGHCEPHGLEACEECDCDCSRRERP